MKVRRLSVTVEAPGTSPAAIAAAARSGAARGAGTPVSGRSGAGTPDAVERAVADAVRRAKRSATR